MSEISESSSSISSDIPLKKSSWEIVKTAANIALNPNYDQNVNPNEYEAHVERVFKRTAQAKLLQKLIEQYQPPLLQDGSSAKVLDIASGTGIVSRALQEGGFNVTAMDLSEHALSYLRNRSTGIDALKADMNELLPLMDNSFNAVTTVWGNRFIKDSDLFLEEVQRVLKPEGVLVWPVFMSERISWKIKNGIRQHTTAQTLKEDSLKAGFREAEVITMNPLEAIKQKIPVFAIPKYIIARK